MVSAWVTPAEWKVAQLSGPAPVISLCSAHIHILTLTALAAAAAGAGQAPAFQRLMLFATAPGREGDGKQRLVLRVFTHRCRTLGSAQRGEAMLIGAAVGKSDLVLLLP